ncbi:MAG: hypothetical protein U5K74_05710 [Gemmatimonadaceae bacterium]|nr:hypothetical protein [Gemmatimonadaceae bacterium]
MRSASAMSASVGQPHGAHRHGLQRLLGHVPQHARGVEPDLRPLRGNQPTIRLSVATEDIVERRLQVGVAEPLHHHTVDLRHMAVDRHRPIHAHDGADPDVRVECGPEVELVRRVGTAFGGHHAPQRAADLSVRCIDHDGASREGSRAVLA